MWVAIFFSCWFGIHIFPGWLKSGRSGIVQVWNLCITLTWSNTPSVCYCGLFVVRQVALSKVTLQRCNLQGATYYVACGSAIHMCHLSVALVEFADTDTAQKMHHRADIDSWSDYRCITIILFHSFAVLYYTVLTHTSHYWSCGCVLCVLLPLLFEHMFSSG